MEHSPEVFHIPPGTACIFVYIIDICCWDAYGYMITDIRKVKWKINTIKLADDTAVLVEAKDDMI